ncbi:hypothetical protein SAMN02745121_08291 [Nannocystis exedens]|uniref:Uncharacterized protein n=1 Tax=Nannocystis exedens TaxID=54 RepID=A0A1I2I0K9_9BACT|nr:hypothetical protein [Nannocystis exedens]PCC66397.1 hypothetical protein NAEX_08985 [Nannocystis exedens]SFF34597.1 hypothetical protein SAMN02745121_08291 [Nannocystis exedens]
MTPRRPRQTFAPGVALAMLVALAGCRPKAGDPCRCASDCGVGLECYAEGEKILSGDACFKPGVIGTCVVSESVDTDSAGPGLPDMPIRDDLPSKRDIAGPGSNSISESATGPTDGSATASSMTGTTTDGTATDGTATDTTTTSSTTDTTTTSTTDTTTTSSTTDSSTSSTTSTSTDSTTTTGSTTESTSSTGSTSSGSSSG